MARDLSRVPTVLLVESPQDDRDMYAEYFSLVNFRALECGDTADALARSITADAIVTGIRVPGPFDGVELVRRLREDSRTRQKPIIVLTASPFEGNRRRAYEAGCDVFLAKPCVPERLAEEVCRLLEFRPQEREIA